MRNKILTYLLLLPLLCLAQGQAENRIVAFSYLDADGSDSICKILYYDELEREEQKVIVGGSPIGKSKEVDILAERKYPYTSSIRNSLYPSNWMIILWS